MKLRLASVLVALTVLASCTGTGAKSPGLSIQAYPLKQAPEAESDQLIFADSVKGDPRTARADERAEVFADISCMVGSAPGLCIQVGGAKLVAYEDWGNPADGYVIVTRDGQLLHKVSVGSASPVTALRGLWTYGEHWAMETAAFDLQSGVATGRVIVDGEPLNEKLGYDESFGFQTLGGKPFYFFSRDGKIDANYDGADVALGYDEIPHYSCCSASTLNPKIAQKMLACYARQGETWSYVEIGAFD